MKLFHVDAFTHEAFKGNSAGVVLLDSVDIEDSLKQSIASELRHSETAFVLIKGATIGLRWFTPAREVDLCGHATLAAAHALWESGLVEGKDTISFSTKAGELGATRRGDKIELDFPQLFVEPCAESEIVNEAFGINPIYTAKNEKRYLLHIEDADQLRSLKPNFELLKKADLGAFMITCASDRPGFDFLSRFFAPIVGVPEDPVTGSAHCYLAPYWGKILAKNPMMAFQESARTGIMECELVGDSRVKLRGEAKTLYTAELRL